MKQVYLILLFVSLILGCNSLQNPPGPGEEGEETIEGQIGDNKIGPISIVSVGHTSASIEASWEGFGSVEITEFGFVWGDNNDPQLTPENSKIWKQNPQQTVGLNKAFTHTIEDLAPETEYWVRSYMKASGISGKLGTAFPFTTLGTPPVVETGVSSNVDANTFTVSGKILDLGSSEIVEFGHIMSLSGPPSINSEKESHDGPVPVGHEFESTFVDLLEGQLYYFNTYAINQSGALALGEPRTVRTEALPDLYVESITLVSDHGNLDNIVNRGEELEYQIKVKNSGSLAANGVKLELIEDSPYITNIEPNLIELGTVPGGNTQSLDANEIRIQVDPFANWDSTVNIQLLLSDQEGRFWTDTLSFVIESSFVVTDGLLAYFTFDRDDHSGLFANSELNNASYSALKNNDPSYSTDVPNFTGGGHSMQFSAGKKTYLNLGKNPIHGRNNFTFTCWIKTSDTGDYIYFEKTQYTPFNYLALFNSMEYYYHVTAVGAIYRFNYGISPQTVADDEWHLLAVSKNGTTKKFYIDGIRVSISTENQVSSTPSEGIAIGAKVRNQSTAIESPFQGLMDNIRFYNRTLSSEEIYELFQKRQ